MPKQLVKKNLINAEESQVFWLANGRQLKNLFELAECLETIDDQTYAHHVNKERNDFARWIHDILDDEELAAKIWRFKSKSQILKLLKSHLKKNY